MPPRTPPRTSHRIPRPALRSLALRSLATAILLFLILPVLVVIPLSFSSGEMLTVPIPGLSWRWYQDLFANPRWLLAARNSLALGASTVALATTIGTAAALGLYLGRFPGKVAIIAILSLPMVTPVIIAAVALYAAFSWAGLTRGPWALILAHAALALPYVLLTVLAALQGFDNTLLRAAAASGASPPIVFARIILPLIAPAVAAGAIFAFAISFDDLVVALFLATPEQFTLPRQMYAGINDFLSPTLCAAAVLLVLCSLLLLAAMELARRDRN